MNNPVPSICSDLLSNLLHNSRAFTKFVVFVLSLHFFTTSATGQSLSPGFGFPTGPVTPDFTRFISTGDSVGPVPIPSIRSTLIASEDRSLLVADGFTTKTLSSRDQSNLIMRSGSVTERALAWDDSLLELRSGRVSSVETFNGSRLVLDGANVTGAIVTGGESIVELRSGVVGGNVTLDDSSILNVTDGEISSSVVLNDSSSAIFSGGEIGGNLFSFSDSRFEILNNLDAGVWTFHNSTGLVTGEIKSLWAYGSSETVVNEGLVGSVSTAGSSRVEFLGGALSDTVQPAASVGGTSELWLNNVRTPGLPYIPYGELQAYVFQSGRLIFVNGVMDKVTVRNRGKFYLEESRVRRIESHDDSEIFLVDGEAEYLDAHGGRVEFLGASVDSAAIYDGTNAQLRSAGKGGEIRLLGGTMDLYFEQNPIFSISTGPFKLDLSITDGELILHRWFRPNLQSIIDEFGTDFPASSIPEEGLTLNDVWRRGGTIVISKTNGASGMIRIR